MDSSILIPSTSISSFCYIIYECSRYSLYFIAKRNIIKLALATNWIRKIVPHLLGEKKQKIKKQAKMSKQILIKGSFKIASKIVISNCYDWSFKYTKHGQLHHRFTRHWKMFWIEAIFEINSITFLCSTLNPPHINYLFSNWIVPFQSNCWD